MSPEEFERLKKQAEEAKDASQISEAVRLYRQILTRKAGWSEGWWYLGTLHYDSDQYALAEGAFRELTSREPKNAHGWAMLGLCEYRTRKFAAALDHLVRGRSLGLGDNEDLARVVRYHQALLLNAGRQFEAAQVLLNGFAVEQRESAQVLDALGMSVLRIPRLPEDLSEGQKQMVRDFGRAAFLAAARKREESGRLYSELETRYGKSPNVAYAYGVFLLTQKETDRALEFFKKELEQDPKHTASLLQLALNAINAGRFQEGLPYAQRAVTADPENFAGHYALGRIYTELDEIPKAVATLEKAAKIAPDAPSVYFVLSRAYARAKRPVDAARARTEFARLEALDKKRRGEATGEP